MGEHRIRDLNDEINKLLREKYHWEERIHELGGADYRKSSSKIVDSQGIELPSTGGYKYFGAAKDLPGVRELFHKETPQAPNKSHVDLYKVITYDYYGEKANEDEDLLREESMWEEKYREEEIRKWIENNASVIKKLFKGKNAEEIEVAEVLKIINQDFSGEINGKSMEIEKNSRENEKKNQENEKEDELKRRKNEILKKYFNEEKNTEKEQDEEGKILKDLIEMNEEL